MNKIIKSCTLLALLFSLSSCNLDRNPEDMIPTEDVMNDLNDAKQVVFGIYSAFKSSSLYSGHMTLVPDLQADYIYAVNGYLNTYGAEYRWEIRQTSSIIGDVYGDLYVIVGRANFFLNNADKVEATLITAADRDMFAKCKGDAHFARALAYSELIKLYCGNYVNDENAKTALGIVLEETFDPVQKPKMRSNLYDSYLAILEDLKVAEQSLDIRDYANSEYFTIGTVQALFARVYLNMGYWDKAEEYATKVIDNKLYTMADATRFAAGQTAVSDYDLMWIIDSHDEIIWKVSFSQNDYGGSLSRIFQGFNGLNFTPDYVPTREFVASYALDDYRYRSFFQRVKTGHTHGLETEILMKYHRNPNIDGTGAPLYVNMPKVFRLSEQYLIRAEARYNGGDEAGACEDISVLRRARYNKYGSYIASGEVVLKTIKEERKKELSFEGFRLNDLKRWGEGFKRVRQVESVAGPDILDIKSDNLLFVWPIPKNELDTNPQLQPNPSNIY